MTFSTVITDASYCDRRRVGGWAAWVRIDGHPVAIKGYGTLKADMHNSTMAEVYAALNGVWLASVRGATEILVRSDCMAVSHLIDGKATKPYLIDIWAGAMGSPWASNITKITARHVKGHVAIKDRAGYVNNWCDQYARKGLDAARSRKQMTNITGV